MREKISHAGWTLYYWEGRRRRRRHNVQFFGLVLQQRQEENTEENKNDGDFLPFFLPFETNCRCVLEQEEKEREREKEIVNTKNKHSLLCYEPRRCRFACMFVNEQEPKEKTGFIPFFSSFHRQRLLVRKNESERKKNRE